MPLPVPILYEIWRFIGINGNIPNQRLMPRKENKTLEIKLSQRNRTVPVLTQPNIRLRIDWDGSNLGLQGRILTAAEGHIC